MKTYTTLLFEKNFHDTYKQKNKWFLLKPEEAEDFVDDFFNLVYIAYKEIGGHSTIKSPEDLKAEIKKDSLYFYATDIDTDDDADAINFGKKTNHGFKFVGMGQDGEKQSKKETLSWKAKILKTRGYYVEVSDKIAEILLNRDRVPCVTDEQKAKDILHPKQITWYGEHPLAKGLYPEYAKGWYKRIIGNEEHFKIIIGMPK